MFWPIIILAILGLFIIKFLEKEKFILSLPYLLMIIITPIYAVLDHTVFVKVFGCGCVPSAQTNMLNIPFNANDLRAVVYIGITIISLILGIFLSKKLDNKKSKALYFITILAFNILLTYEVCQVSMWA